MPAGPSTSFSRSRGLQTAARILDAAEALFAEQGYAGTSLRDVADRVGLRIPSLYNHFPSKDALYTAVLERGIAPVLAILSGFADAGADIQPDSREVVRRVMRLLAQRPNLPRLVLHETLSGGQRLTPLLRQWIAPTFARAHEMIEMGPGANRWRPDQIPLLVLAMYHIVVGYFAIAPLYRQLNGEDLLTKEALDRQTDFLGEVVVALLEAAP
ncbi:MAG: TetR/AcrR family transcriptional regulator, partial [Myxococcota bacterium]